MKTIASPFFLGRMAVKDSLAFTLLNPVVAFIALLSS